MSNPQSSPRAVPAGFSLLLIVAAAATAARGAGGGGLSLRQRALRLLGDDPEIVFAVRAMGRDGHWYANFGHWSSDPRRMMYGPPGGKLCRLNLRTGEATVVLGDPDGGVRDPHVHYDGRKILFSYRRGGGKHYHLYEIKPNGTALRQITDGPWDDIEPIYLPDGDIVFGSSRCNRWVQCWHTQVAILYRCDAEGGGIRPLSANVEQDNTPWMLPDGRVLFMRWEYVDRSRVKFHHLWTINPDGTGQMVYFGNMHPGTVMLDAKPIPSTGSVVSIFSPGHGRKEHAGRLAIVSPDAGPDERRWVTYVGRGSNYRDPYPLAADLFLVAENDRLLLIDARGRTEEIHRVTGRAMAAHEPRPLRPRRREHLIPPRVDYSRPTGRLVLADVTHGRNMQGVKPGEIRKLLVLETLPKPVNFSGTMEPISLGGTFTLPRVLGTVPVEPDGSAYMEVPALRSLFFVALDASGMSVKRMQSFVSVMPGETTSCSGCHENRTDTARFTGDLLATQRPPAEIRPIRGVPDVLDFPRDIQPILDRRCLPCHGYKQRPPADLPLVGARSGQYSHSYYALMSRGLVSHGRDAHGNKRPRGIGTSASPLMKKLDGSHNKVELSPLERTKVRLWIESGAQYPGTYASLGSGMVSVSVRGDVLGRRCAGCHAVVGRGVLRSRYGRELLCNLTDPARSPILLAPLSRSAGGWGLCKGKPRARRPARDANTSVAAVFETAKDPDYQKILADIAAAKARLDAVTRFDMPDFRPNRHYVREMKRYGILPAGIDPLKQRIDVYKTDEAYWRSFWYRPAGK